MLLSLLRRSWLNGVDVPSLTYHATLKGESQVVIRSF